MDLPHNIQHAYGREIIIKGAQPVITYGKVSLSYIHNYTEVDT